ncbi:MAG: ferric reductase-like transmembrane domain-containing protein [Acidimicrobiia bacterium]
MGTTLGTGRDLRRRILLHHVPLAITSAVGLVVLIGLAPAHGSFSVQRLASPTGDVALVLLAVTLLIGPANLLFRRRNPVNTYLRRDVGTWTAIWSIVHVVVGFQGHGGGAFGFIDYFVADGKPLTNSFGMGNWTGLAATVIVVLLLVLSTDRYLRELKARSWKNLQRLNYALFGLVVLHAVYYGALRRMTSPFTRLLIITVIAVIAGQAVGIWLWRRGNATHLASRASGSASGAAHAHGKPRDHVP